MSQPHPSPQTTIAKSHFDNGDDNLFEELSLPFNQALNGGDIGRYHSPKLHTKSNPGGRLDPEAFRRLSISTVSSRGMSPYPLPLSNEPRTSRASIHYFWLRNQGIILVILSQAFGALMNVATRLLELEDEGMHPFQILFVRMGLTSLFCCLWMWWTKVPDFPLGVKEERGLLVARGLSGFFGVYGMYYSLQYLPIADAIVITFLAPSVAAYACYLFLNEPFPRSAQYASLISLLGVVLIARPTSFFSSPQSPTDAFTVPGNGTVTQGTPSTDGFPIPTSSQRLSAILVALIGVLGSAAAYTTIRLIGDRAHPLVSVNYFAVWCTIVSAFVLLLAKPLHLSSTLSFAFPTGLRQWSMLGFLGVCGFIMQYLLTKGLSGKGGGVRATNMIYTNMLFALGLDRLIFKVVPGWWSLTGSGLILGSAIFIAMSTSEGGEVEKISDEEAAVVEERMAILDGDETAEEEEAEVRTSVEL